MKRVGLDYSVCLLLTHEQYGGDQDCDGDSRLLEATILGFESPYAFDKGLEIKVVRLHRTSLLAAFSHIARRENEAQRGARDCNAKEGSSRLCENTAYQCCTDWPAT